MTPELHRLIQTAILMAQELQEIVDDAKQASDEPDAMQATQDLINDWEEAFAAAGVEPRWQDVLAGQCDDEERLKL